MRRIEPGPGQESVWDYPRPPAVAPVPSPVRVEFAGEVVAASERALRVLETSHPPAVYLPREDCRMDLMEPLDSRTWCEFKGTARYLAIIVDGARAEHAAWTYPDPAPAYAELEGFVSFYPSRVDACFIGDERVQPQEGDFYGGWITEDIVGPFKGGAGTRGW